ncbi:MAG: hypothetical protein AB1529_07220 [Candidatus Micrarchaeota archaeon]
MKSSRPLRVRSIHILVHPGFSSDPAFYSEPDLVRNSRRLFDRYHEKAGGMGHDELMVALTHSNRQFFRDDAKGGFGYADWLKELRDVLGKRLIVLCDETAESPDAARMALRIARARGFSVSRWVRTVAYGEMLGECVERAAEAFNRSAMLHRKTEIDVGSTDYGLYYDSIGPDGIGDLLCSAAGRIAYALPGRKY